MEPYDYLSLIGKKVFRSYISAYRVALKNAQEYMNRKMDEKDRKM